MKQKQTKEEKSKERQEVRKDNKIFYDLIRRLKAKGIEFTTN